MNAETRKLHIIQAILKIENDAVLTAIETVVDQKQVVVGHKGEFDEQPERNLQDLQQQNATLQLVLDDKQNIILSLQESLTKEQRKTKDLEAKLVLNNQLIAKIYGDLAKSLSNNPKQQQNVLSNKNKGNFSDLLGALSEEEAENMKKVIAENFERTNPDDWK